MFGVRRSNLEAVDLKVEHWLIISLLAAAATGFGAAYLCFYLISIRPRKRTDIALRQIILVPGKWSDTPKGTFLDSSMIVRFPVPSHSNPVYEITVHGLISCYWDKNTHDIC